MAGISDPNVAANRPLDLSFLIDRFTAFDTEPGNAFAGAIDTSRIGASGHSFGGFTVFALAGGGGAPGTFTDPPVRAILPQAPAAPFPPAFFATITIPTLILGGSIDETTPFESQQHAPSDALPPGAGWSGREKDAGALHGDEAHGLRRARAPRAAHGHMQPSWVVFPPLSPVRGIAPLADGVRRLTVERTGPCTSPRTGAMIRHGSRTTMRHLGVWGRLQAATNGNQLGEMSHE